MIEPENWCKLVKSKTQMFFCSGGEIISAPIEWFRTLRYSEELGFTCGTGLDVVNLKDIYLSEADCMAGEIEKMKTKGKI